MNAEENEADIEDEETEGGRGDQRSERPGDKQQRWTNGTIQEIGNGHVHTSDVHDGIVGATIEDLGGEAEGRGLLTRLRVEWEKKWKEKKKKKK